MLFIRTTLVAILSLVLISCATISSNKNKAEETQELNVYIFSDKNINKDIYDVPSPTRLTFLQLATVIEFNQMSEMSDNSNDYKKLLGNSVLNEINVTIKPGETINFQLPLEQDSRYLGVIAAFREVDNNWKLSLTKQKSKKKLKDINFLYITLEDNNITQISKEEAILKIATKKLDDEGKDITQLNDTEKEQLFENIDKELAKKEPIDVSKGLFIQINKESINNSKINEDTDTVATDNELNIESIQMHKY